MSTNRPSPADRTDDEKRDVEQDRFELNNFLFIAKCVPNAFNEQISSLESKISSPLNVSQNTIEPLFLIIIKMDCL